MFYISLLSPTQLLCCETDETNYEESITFQGSLQTQAEAGTSPEITALLSLFVPIFASSSLNSLFFNKSLASESLTQDLILREPNLRQSVPEIVLGSTL